MCKKNVEELANEHVNHADEISKYLFETLDKRLEEHPASIGEVIVALGMFASMVLANTFEKFEGMNANEAAYQTKRWASIVVSEVSDYFNENDKVPKGG